MFRLFVQSRLMSTFMILATVSLGMPAFISASTDELRVIDCFITFKYNKVEKAELVLHKVHFYKDRSGKAPVEDYLIELAAKKDKDSRIKLNKIRDYIKILSELGTKAGEPYMKHIVGDIWELRPLRDRIFFVGWANGSYVLLHCFTKKTQKTPAREIEKAKRNLADLTERSVSYD